MPESDWQQLHWNVMPLALARGFKSVPKLGFALETSRQGIYPIWRGQAVSISLEMYTKLCLVLRAEPGDWFKWIDTGEGRSLAWNVQEATEQRGLTMARLGFKTEMYPRSMLALWRNESKSAFVETLSKIAQVLDQQKQPFSIGDLFTWEVPDLGQSTGQVPGIRRRLQEEGEENDEEQT